MQRVNSEAARKQRHKVAKLLVQGTKVPLHAVTREQYFQYCMPVRLNIRERSSLLILVGNFEDAMHIREFAVLYGHVFKSA